MRRGVEKSRDNEDDDIFPYLSSENIRKHIPLVYSGIVATHIPEYEYLSSENTVKSGEFLRSG